MVDDKIKLIGKSRIRIGEIGEKSPRSRKRFFLAIYEDLGLNKKEAEALRIEIVKRFNNYTGSAMSWTHLRCLHYIPCGDNIKLRCIKERRHLGDHVIHF